MKKTCGLNSIKPKIVFLGVLGVLVSWWCKPAAADVAGLIAPDAKVEKLAGDFKFTEGPAADKDGNVFFTDIPNNRIHKWSVDGKLSTAREDSGAANGLYFDKDGDLLACEGGARRVTSMTPAGTVSVLADAHGGKKLNSPNDLWIDPKGGVYFTDPRYGKSDDLEQDGQHVYYIAPDRKTVVRVVNDMTRPNGVLGTPDGKTLFVADHGAKKVYAYAIREDGTLADKKLFAESECDGMTRDEQGNVYLTAAGVAVFDKDGKSLGVIEVPERPANVTFGGADRKTLFITARTSLYAVKMRVQGAR